MNVSVCAVIIIVLLCVIAAVLFVRAKRGGKAETAAMSGEDAAAEAAALLAALGGRDNIAAIEHCTTRLRAEVKSYSAVDEAAAKQAGASGVVRPAKTTCMLVVGEHAPQLYDEIKKLL